MSNSHAFRPFENDTQSITIGPGTGFTFENGTDEIIAYGQLNIKKNESKKSLESLIEFLEKIKENLK